MVIVILIMTLLSLVVISMTKNANREQRQALDRQLSSQAFYAAESGINDAKDYYAKHANDPVNPAPEEKNDCGPLSGASAGDQFPGHSSQVGSDVNVYSCVLYDAKPNSLVFSDINTDTGAVMPIEDKNGSVIRSLTFTWKRPNNTTYNFSGCPSSGFPRELTDCDAGMLRLELIDPAATTRADFIAKDFLSFISPSSSGASNPASPNYSAGLGTANQGVVWRGGCTNGTDGKCSITVNNINRNKLLLHLRSLYNNNYVDVTGVTTTGDRIEFENGQMMIDSTGRAVDSSKRIQVRSPLNNYGNGVYPEFALQTADGICKLLQVIPAGFPDAQSSNGGCAL